MGAFAAFYGGGLCCGSFLSAIALPRWFLHKDVTQNTKDGNPGTANAFLQGGPVCGTAVLLCDLLKGALPVWLCAKVLNPLSLWFVPVLVAPVFGHAHSCLFRGRGGKCIAVSFGVLLGLLPLWQPLVLLAVFYIMFSTLIRVPDHARRTILSFACWTVSVVLFVRVGSIAAPALALRPLSCAGISSRSGRSNGKTQPARDEYMDAKEAVAKQAIAVSRQLLLRFALRFQWREKPREETHFPG